MTDTGRPEDHDRHRLRFCPDCGAAGDGRDTCPKCARTLLSSAGLAAALAESVAVRAAGRLGHGYRWVRADRRRFLVARVVTAVGGLLLISGTSFAAGLAVHADEHAGTSISADRHEHDQHHD